ncbi:MAG: hypothetical protein GXX78_08255 [Bacteroidales bacterium]|nr:hypothetical protein [Bacteroidales bacterium]
MNKITFILIAICIFSSFYACKEDEFTDSVFQDAPAIDPTSPAYNFEMWLESNFRKPYNLSFQYRMEDVGSDQDYNLVPASLEKSKQLAQLIKYLWFDVYASMVDEEFLKKYGPRMIHLIGSAAYNPNSGTMLLGTAEGGIKVTLYSCNDLDLTSFSQNNLDLMNEYYFKTMHHEFTHILHQTKDYPRSFEKISAGKYSPMGWQYRTDEEAAKLGFISTYAGSEAREDFVEIIANYLVKSDKDWNAVVAMAGTEGASIINQKLTVCTDWLLEKWNIDIAKMRAEILRRQQSLDASFYNNDL